MKNALNQKAVNPGNAYMVINRKENRAVESHVNAENALHAVDNLNDHERQNGRHAVFAVLCLRTGSVITGE